MTTPRFTSTVATVALALIAVGCATTVEDETEPTITVATGLQPADESAAQLESEVIVDEAPPTTLPIEGSANDLLPDLAIEMSRLSGTIVEGGDAETIAIVSLAGEYGQDGAQGAKLAAEAQVAAVQAAVEAGSAEPQPEPLMRVSAGFQVP